MSGWVEGIDVSHWQGEIDWRRVAAAGKRFAWIKATEGIGRVDPRWRTNFAGARAAGLLVGSYHFCRPQASEPEPQAVHFVHTAGRWGRGLLPHVVDLEDTKTATAFGTARLVEWAKAFCHHVQVLSGRPPIFYSYVYYLTSTLGDTHELDNYPLWIADYRARQLNAGHPGIERPWQIWQYSQTGQVPGIAGDVDLDRFAGNINDLRRLAGKLPTIRLTKGG